METFTLIPAQSSSKEPSTNVVSFDPIVEVEPSNDKAFILANTVPMSLKVIEQEHIIPVFVKDNEPLISHVDFIQGVEQVTHHVFSGEKILSPSIRLSHPVKGRIPEARHKPAKELLKHEETIYYERCAFMIELPNITEIVNGNQLSLTIGGVKAYNLDNLYNRKGADEHFKVFIGFENRVCTNLCVWSDGYVQDLKVKNMVDLCNAVFELLTKFHPKHQTDTLRKLGEYTLQEEQFARLIGRTRMYQYLPNTQRKSIPKFLFPDGHLNAVVKDYYNDQSFCRLDDGSISLWRLYNLFTGANKQSYIDTFLDRSQNAFDFVKDISYALDNSSFNWFLQ